MTRSTSPFFQNKSATLLSLENRLERFHLKPQFSFSAGEWRKNKTALLEKIASFSKEERLILRSSASAEDGKEGSLAGHFRSTGPILKSDVAAVEKGVETVFASYAGLKSIERETIFAQEFVENIRIKGVVLTADPSTSAPYTIVNYDDRSGSFEAITDGQKGFCKTYVRFNDSPFPPRDPFLVRLFEAVRELESLFSGMPLDIEFALDGRDRLFLLQVRPIAAGDKRPPERAALKECLRKAEKKFEKINAPYPYLYGDRTFLGVMPDWNPAEMIGLKPRMLALSLYKELITDAIWAYQRENYGYKNLRSFPLLRSLMGIPYIDVRVTFNSFLPKDLEEGLCHKLVNYYLGRLEANPHHHDKIEFEIVNSCYFLNLPEKLNRLKDFGFSRKEIETLEASLLRLTHAIVEPADGVFAGDLKKIAVLEERQKKIMESDLGTLDKIYWLIEDAKRYGTLPFAGLARAAFIAKQFLNSFVEEGILSLQEEERWLSSMNTVASQLAKDTALLARNKISKEVFLKRYGHLRPGTYDILSKRYDEAFDLYFSFSDPLPPLSEEKEVFQFSPAQIGKIEALLSKQKSGIRAERLIAFIQGAIPAREHAKFVFTRSVSHALLLLENFGGRFGFSRDDLSFLNIRTVLEMYSAVTSEDVPVIFRSDVERYKREHAVSESLKLPQLILSKEDLYEFFLAEGEPNFISLKRIEAEVVSEKDLYRKDLAGKLLLIPSADPGYDWIFSKGIAGLITAYGGANSHMAVRAAELNLPSVIGAGELHFNRWSKARRLDLDCANKTVRIL